MQSPGSASKFVVLVADLKQWSASALVSTTMQPSSAEMNPIATLYPLGVEIGERRSYENRGKTVSAVRALTTVHATDAINIKVVPRGLMGRPNIL